MQRIIQKTLARAAIIGLLLLFSSCSIVRMGYDHGPQLAWWWLDGYIDFSREQKPLAKQAIQQWFDWHRSAQLPEYADWLFVVRSRINEPLTPEQACGWSEALQNIVAPAFDHAVQLGTPVALRLGETQHHYLEQRYAKSNDKLRRDYLQANLKKRLDVSVKRTVKRIKNFYGNIDDTQRDLIIASIEASPFNPEAWLIERQRRQQITLATLQQLAAESVPTEQAAALLRELVEHTYRSDNPDYRAYQIELAEYTCDFIARMHNSTTPAQRQHAHDKLSGWETDLRAVIGNRLLVDSQLNNLLK